MKGITINNIFTILLLTIPWCIGAGVIIYILFCKYMYWLLGYVWYEWTIEIRKDLFEYIFREEIKLLKKYKKNLEIESGNTTEMLELVFYWGVILTSIGLIIATYLFL